MLMRQNVNNDVSKNRPITGGAYKRRAGGGGGVGGGSCKRKFTLSVLFNSNHAPPTLNLHPFTPTPPHL